MAVFVRNFNKLHNYVNNNQGPKFHHIGIVIAHNILFQLCHFPLILSLGRFKIQESFDTKRKSEGYLVSSETKI